MKKIKISFILNIINFVFVLFASIAMFAGFHFMSNTTVLDTNSYIMFRYFTVDSNLLVGIASLLLIIYEVLLINKKIKKIPNSIFIFKHICTVGVVLTFLVTLLFLAPTIKSGFLSLYLNSNFFFHLVVPIISFVSYVFFEKYSNKYRYSFLGIITMVIYSIYYIINIVTHLNGTSVDYAYDFYGFLHGDIMNAIYVIPIMLTVTYLISLTLIHLNKKLLK